MVDTRLEPRRARARLAADRVFGEYLPDQHAEKLAGNRWDCVDREDEGPTQSSEFRPLLPA